MCFHVQVGLLPAGQPHTAKIILLLHIVNATLMEYECFLHFRKARTFHKHFFI